MADARRTRPPSCWHDRKKMGMKSHGVLAVSTWIFWLVLSVICEAAPLLLVDQQNTTSDARFFSGQNRIGQSFTPTLPAVDAVELNLGSLSGLSSTIFVNLRSGLAGPDGLDGAILATSNSVLMPPDTPNEMRHFDFPSRILLTPGALYVFEIVGNSGHAGALSTGDNYPRGSALKEFSAGFDMIFAEGLHVPEPRSMVLLAAAFVALAGLIAGQRSYRPAG
jgi:hypothetical protein